MATNDELTRDMVTNVVNSPDVYKIKPFQMGLVHFHPAMFVSLVSLIAMDKVHVKFAALSGEAGYESGSNTLEFGFTTATTLSEKALVLHESTHALLDIIIAPGQKIGDSEAMAYIVQCQYGRANNTVAGARLLGDGSKEDKVFNLAWAIAGKILKNKKPKAKEYERLKNAVSKHPDYKDTFDDDADWDGVF